MFSGLTHKEQWVLLGFVVVIGVGLATHQVRHARVTRVYSLADGKKPKELSRIPPPQEDPRPTPLPRESDKINLNTATATELQRLEGIGARKAQQILADRAANGPFRSIDDLDRVKGIGPATLENLRPYVTVGEPTAPAPPTEPAGLTGTRVLGAGPGGVPGATVPLSPVQTHFASPPVGNTGPAAARPPININTASLEELTGLSGVGDALARRIVEYRSTYGPFRRVEDLTKVKGIGPKTLEKNRDLIRVD